MYLEFVCVQVRVRLGNPAILHAQRPTGGTMLTRCTPAHGHDRTRSLVMEVTLPDHRLPAFPRPLIPGACLMTMRFLGRAALPAAAVLATIAIAVPASAVPASAGAGPARLPQLDIKGVYVTGVSSGGFMATQLQVAYSGTFDGLASSPPGPTTAARGTSSTSPPAT